jgi:beta-ureidopropionase / N-carbamoyl-L-amino-acid hydrolase
MTAPTAAPSAASAERLGSNLETLATMRDPDRPGWTRRPFTPWYEDARRWVREIMADAGLDVRLDSVGNVIGRLPGRRPDLPLLMTGSHVDSVDGGGRYDGMLGVLGAIEAARLLREQGIALDHTLEVVNFFAEEPTDFGVSAVGSRAMAGVLADHQLRQPDPSGRTLADALDASGFDPTRLGETRRAPGSIAAYLELHIEQGPYLEQWGQPLGVVTAITGFRRHRYTWIGRPDHAGTTSMDRRRDALAGASEGLVAIERHCRRRTTTPLVGTIGRISVAPNATNVVPARVECIGEVRTPSVPLLERVCAANLAAVGRIAVQRGLELEVQQITTEPPVRVPASIQRAAQEACREVGVDAPRLVSMAGHDANQIARLAPVGMLFVPSKDGRSHCPEEWSRLEDMALGVAALVRLLVRLDRQPPRLRPSVEEIRVPNE